MIADQKNRSTSILSTERLLAFFRAGMDEREKEKTGPAEKNCRRKRGRGGAIDSGQGFLQETGLSETGLSVVIFVPGVGVEPTRS